MSYQRYTRQTILSMVKEVEPKRSFFTEMFFGSSVFFETESVEFDMVRGGKRVAPFVSPMVAGRPIAREGFITKSMKPAYLKPSGFVQPTDALMRMAGEGYNNEQMSPQARMDALITQTLVEHDDMITNRIEWMASKAILDGKYTVDGEDYQAVEVDFGHDADLRVALAGAATWNLATSTPIDDIEELAQLVRTKSRGAIANTLIFGSSAWKSFRAHATMKDRIDTNYKRMQLTTMDDGALNDTGAQYVGRLDGRFDMYTFEDYLTDNNGADVAVMDPDVVIICSPKAVEGAQYYGAILDADAGFQAVRSFGKSRSSWDPSGEEVLTQSAPLVAPKRANTWAILNVQ